MHFVLILEDTEVTLDTKVTLDSQNFRTDLTIPIKINTRLTIDF